MRRILLLVPLAALMAVSAFALLRPSSSPAETGRKDAVTSPTAALLPVSRVALFSSGVGYYQREGTVEGSVRVDLSFPVQDINDLLKSMVLRDLDGGHITAVSYDSRDPIDKTLSSYAINLNNNPSFSAILNQARGEKVEVILQQTNATQPGTLTGSVVGVEQQKHQVGKDATVEVEVLNLWCSDGMRAVKLTEVQRVRFLNPIVEGEVKKALDTLALSHDVQKKSVSIQFDGDGKRQVRVGYVVESPVWKTSYRLVLGKEAADKPYLQGWAVVENPTDDDWKDVRLALISGRPISFRMNLYDPLYIQRPVVEPELFASLRPPTYSGSLGDIADGNGRISGGPSGPAAKGEVRRRLGEELEYERGAMPATDASFKSAGATGMDLRQSVASAASASKLGDYFQYAIDKPVTLPRQKSALLPILAQDVGGERVSIYNERTHPKFPLLGLKLKNTTGLPLTQGPITVFEGSTYAGDARILDLQKGEERLLSYAIDLGTEVQAVASSDNGKFTSIKIVKGIIHTTTKVKDSKTYTIVNRNDQDRVVLIEHPNRTDFHLTSQDKPYETAADVHRFQVKVPAGKTVPFTVREEKDFGSTVVLTNADDNTMRVFFQDVASSPGVKDALRRALELKGKLAETQREIQQLERQLKVITDDQARLRANLREMPPTADAYKRYLKKFDDQETQIEKLQDQIKQAQDQEHQQRKDYETFLANLSAE